MISTVFIVCASFGGAILIVQLLLSLVGIGVDADLDLDAPDVDADLSAGDTDHQISHGGDNHHPFDFLLRYFSLRSIVAGSTFFGLGGLLGLSLQCGPGISAGIGIILALIAIYALNSLYRLIAKFQSDGSINAKTLVGAHGQVYLKIPGDGEGHGRVLVTQQERTMEYEAVTPGPALVPGTEILVTAVVSENLVEVAAV